MGGSLLGRLDKLFFEQDPLSALPLSAQLTNEYQMGSPSCTAFVHSYELSGEKNLAKLSAFLLMFEFSFHFITYQI